MKLLLIASDRMELQGLLARCEQARPAALSVDWARLARLGAHDVLLAANGVGARRAASAVDAASAIFSADAIVSLGFCGALAPDLGVADIVVATGIAAADGRFAAQPPAVAPAHRAGTVCSLDHVARTAEEKRGLHATGSIAAEMEAAGVAARAEALGRPFYCVKTVTDLAGESMANDFNSALRSDGHFDTMEILRSSLRHPSVRLPELFRLRKRCLRATKVLGDFVADCRF
jgi:adenosylhomocysteine nucleosidase